MANSKKKFEDMTQIEKDIFKIKEAAKKEIAAKRGDLKKEKVAVQIAEMIKHLTSLQKNIGNVTAVNVWVFVKANETDKGKYVRIQNIKSN